MITKIFGKNPLAIFFILTIATLYLPGSQNTVDLSGKLLKIQEPVMLYDLDDHGFAVYDLGENEIKIFNWDFKVINRFPLKKGEGPGEIKNIVAAACIVKGKIYVAGLFEKKIIVFNPNRKLEREIPLDFMQRDLFYRDGKLYSLNLSINAGEESFNLGKIIDPLSGKPVKDIFLKSKLITPKSLDGNPLLIGLSSTFDVGSNGKVHMLISSANLLVSINDKNQLEYSMELPYKERKTIQTVKSGDEEVQELSVLDWYTDMRAFDDAVYVCFLKTVKEDVKSGGKTYQTVVIKILTGGKFFEKVFDGDCVIIGKHRGYLYFFNCREYKVIPIKLSEW